MRPSSIANRSSYASGVASQANSQTLLLKLAEKRKEYDAVATLDKICSAYVERIAGLANDCDIMALAGEVHGQISEQWPRMFHILNLFLASRESPEEKQNDSNSTEGEMLVRIPIEDSDSENAAAISE